VAINEPFPELDEILASIGEGGQRIATIDAAEGAAGNISVCIGWPIEIRAVAKAFDVTTTIL
jgi:rhamnulose-1-phosphate aldolase